MSSSLSAYLGSPSWKRVSSDYQSRREYKCETCGREEDLVVVLTNAENIGKETDADMKLLCVPCRLKHREKTKKDEKFAELRVDSDFAGLDKSVFDSVRSLIRRSGYSEGQFFRMYKEQRQDYIRHKEKLKRISKKNAAKI